MVHESISRDLIDSGYYDVSTRVEDIAVVQDEKVCALVRLSFHNEPHSFVLVFLAIHQTVEIIDKKQLAYHQSATVSFEIILMGR